MGSDLVNREIVQFGRIPFVRQLELYSPARIAWALRLPIQMLELWGYYIPEGWSQYIRESESFTRQVNRRHMRTELACAVLRDKRRLYTELGLSRRFSDAYLPEHESLRIEYTYRGLVQCETICSQPDGAVVPTTEHAMLGHSRLLPPKSTVSNSRGILLEWRALNATA